MNELMQSNLTHTKVQYNNKRSYKGKQEQGDKIKTEKQRERVGTKRQGKTKKEGQEQKEQEQKAFFKVVTKSSVTLKYLEYSSQAKRGLGPYDKAL